MRIDLYGDGIGAVELVQHMGDDLTIVNAARVSFDVHKTELDDRDRKLIKYLADHSHTSPFEHCSVTFKFTVPLYVRSQHHRHRTWSYNEVSRRYTSENMRFYVPLEYRKQAKSNRQASTTNDVLAANSVVSIWPKHQLPEFAGACTLEGLYRSHCDRSMHLYEGLLELGVCREQARGVLPQTLYTDYFGTTNLHNLAKFIELRRHEGAQWEIQRVAEACEEIARSLWPIASSALFTGKGAANDPTNQEAGSSTNAGD